MNFEFLLDFLFVVSFFAMSAVISLYLRTLRRFFLSLKSNAPNHWQQLGRPSFAPGTSPSVLMRALDFALKADGQELPMETIQLARKVRKYFHLAGWLTGAVLVAGLAASFVANS